MTLFSLVVPLYNEEGVLRPVADGLLQAFRQAGEPLELVLVDNGSHDGTGREIEALKAVAPEVRQVRVEVNQGYGWGVLCGLREATGTHLGYMAGDGQIEASDVVAVWQRMKAGNCDVAKTCRVRREDGPIRQVVTFFCNIIFPVVFPVRTRDINGTPKIMTRQVYQDLKLESKDWFLDAELMIKCARRGLRVAEVPVTFRARAGGISHVRFSSLVEFMVNIARAWWKGIR
ncbi:MAG TPA: glycosyltransferase family 2 protein [Candidatus Xenobia bacterium]